MSYINTLGDFLSVAKEWVAYIEKRHRYPDPTFTEKKRKEYLEKVYKPDAPPVDDVEVHKMRLYEMMEAYLKVSDGKGGINPSASPEAKKAYENVLKGVDRDGNLLPSQKEAIRISEKKPRAAQVITENTMREVEKWGPKLTPAAQLNLEGVTLSKLDAAEKQKIPLSQVMEQHRMAHSAHKHAAGAKGFARIDLLGLIATVGALTVGLLAAGKAEANTPGFEEKDFKQKSAQVSERFAKDNIPGAETALNGNKASGAYQFVSSVVGGMVRGTLSTCFNTTALLTKKPAEEKRKDLEAGQKLADQVGDWVDGSLNRHNPFEGSSKSPLETGPGVTKQVVVTPTMAGPG